MSGGTGNGKGLNGGQNVSALATAIPAASMRNLPPGAQINQLLLNKNKHLQANNGFGNLAPSSGSLVNGNAGNLSSSPFSVSGGSDSGIVKRESPPTTTLPPAVTALQNGTSSVGDSASETGSVLSDPTRREPSTSSSTSPSKSSEHSDGSKSGPGWVQPPYRPSSTTVLRNTNQLEYIKAKMIKAMIKHPHSWPFRVPVDAIKLNILDYHDIIKNPMDLGTISKRLDYYWYSNAVQCIQDFKVMFTNCYTYNQAGEDVVKMANELEKVFLAKLGQLPSEEVEIPVKLRPGKAKRGPGRPAGSGNKKTVIGFSLPTKTATLSGSSSLSASSTTSSTSPVTVSATPASAPSPAIVHSANRAPVRPPSQPQPFKTVEIPSTSNPKPKGLPPAPARSNNALPPSTTKTPTFQPQPPKTVTVPAVKVEKVSPVKKKPGEVLKEQMAYCYALLKEMRGKKHEAYAWPFYEPVDAVALGLTDYHQKIKKPMDLRTMMTRFDQGLYHTPQQFADDLRLIFFNCYRYNPKDTKLLNMAWKLQDFFETRWAKLPYDLPCTPRMVREQQGLMLYAPNDANAPTDEELGRESDRSPTPRAGTSKDSSPPLRKKKEPVASTSKNASAPGAVAELQAQLAALQAQVKAIAADKASQAPPGEAMNVVPAVTSVPFPSQVRGRKPGKKAEAPSSILVTLMDHDAKKGASTPPAAARSPKSKTVKRTASQVDDEEPSSSTSPTKKPRKPRTPKEKAPPLPLPSLVEKVPEKTASPPSKPPVAVATLSHIATPVTAAPPSSSGSGMTATTLSPKRSLLNVPPAHTKVREMSYEEKQQLSIHINELTPENLEKVVQIIQSMEPQYAEAPEELEIDFEMLRPTTLCALEDFINETKGIKKNNHQTGISGGNTLPVPPMAQGPLLPPGAVSLPQVPVQPKEKSPKGSHTKGGHSKKTTGGKAYSQASSSGSSSSDSDSTDSESEVEGDVVKKAGSQAMAQTTLLPPVGPSAAISQVPVFGAAPRMAPVFPPVLNPPMLTQPASTIGVGLAGLSAVAQQAAQDLTASKGSLFGIKNAPKDPQPKSPPAAVPALKNWGTAFGKGASLASGGGSSTTVFNESFEQFRKQAKEKEEKQKQLRQAETEKRQLREQEQREKAKKERAQASERDQELELEKARRAHFEGGPSMPSNGFGFHNRDRIQALSTNSPNAAYQASPTSSMSPASSIPLSPASQVASPPEASGGANPQSERDKQRQREAERRRRAATAGRIDLTHQHDLMSTFEHQMY
ncbi:hypothetical protein RvY_16037 [Ramazzottius varieornatus]|uniref:Bromo domain-containing protein n=1 Tax=Ramazzottius varieornatus TaxID=947166 RepID=A0A1D1W011_RAMVA|nr:hypothetical protein RvY_16037 [Ramazzottius varieornatus]